jgi:hypothetical protein
MHLYIVCILNHIMHFDFFSRNSSVQYAGKVLRNAGHRKTEHDMKGP